MKRRTWAFLFGVLALSGCGGNPLVGHWTTSYSQAGATITVALQLVGDNTMSYTASASGCSGSLMVTGQTWSSTATTITVSGMPMCTGTLQCGPISAGCGQLSNNSGACTYTVSSDNNSFTTTNCSDSTNNHTWTRTTM